MTTRSKHLAERYDDCAHDDTHQITCIAGEAIAALRTAEDRIAEHNFENRLLANADRDIKALRLRIAELEVFISQSCYVFDGRDADISDAYIDAATSSLMPKVSTKSEDELFRYCSDGSCSCLPGGAC